MNLPQLTVRRIDRGMRIDYEPISPLAKLIATTCGQSSLTKKQIALWRKWVKVEVLR